MKYAFQICLFFCFLFLSPSQLYAFVFTPDLKTAQHAYKKENYALAYKHWKALENYNDPKTHLGLGKLYARGLHVEQNYKKSLLHFMKAAEKNNKKAQYEIAYAYEKGRGVEKNKNKAQQWYAISVAQGYERAQKRLSALNEEYKPPVTKAKPEKKKYKVLSALRSQFIVEDNLSLNNGDSSSALITEGQIRATYTPIQDVRLHVQARAVNSTGNATSNDDDFDETMNANFIEVRQAWAEKKNLFNHAPLSLKIGRQRFREDRGNWWNRDLDAIRLSYNSTLSSGFLALGQNFSKYRLGSDNNLENDEESRLRFFGEASHKLSQAHTIEGRFLYEYDHSNTPRIGQLINANNHDETDYNIFWSGVRAYGHLPTPEDTFITNLKYHADIATAIGTETVSNTQSTATPNLRRVSSTNEKDVFGWSFDGRIETTLDSPLSPIFILGYAYGSGDNGSSSNSAFRQTGLNSNTSRYPDNRIATSLRQYGEVLRPELSNIHILNAGLNFPLFDKGDLNFHYYSYWRANDQTGLMSNGIDQNLNGDGNHIGQAFDVSMNHSLDELLQQSFDRIRSTNLRLKLGSFYSGDAYGSAEGEIAFKGTAEVSVKF